MSALDPATRSLVAFAAQVPGGSEAALVAAIRAVHERGPAAWLDELVMMAVLFVGFPRALVAASALRQVVPQAGDIGDAADYGQWQEWQTRGEATCRTVYRGNYDKLRANVRTLQPAIDAWMVVDGYGRTLSRPGLDLRRRELCVIAMLAPQDTPRQLLSHLRGALNAGATEADVTETLATIEHVVSPERMTAAHTQWNLIRGGVS